jgi:hypothetical protein
MLRVVLGRARPDTEWSEKISGLQFNSTPGAQERTRSGDASAIMTVPRSPNGRETVDLDANGESRTAPLDSEEEIYGMKEGKTRI